MLGNKLEVCQYFKMARKLHLRPPINDEVNKETSFIKRVNFRGHFSDASFNKEFVVSSFISSQTGAVFSTTAFFFLDTLTD